VIAFDEPTSSLTPAERDGLFRIIRDLRNAGKAIVYISHRMPEIMEIADRVTVLRDGRVVASGPIANFTQGRLTELIAGRDLDKGLDRWRTAARRLGGETLRLERVSTASIRDVSLVLREGEIFGLIGLVGSGRTEVARAVFGVDPLIGGAMSIGGKPYAPKSPSEAIAAGVALIPEDRRRHAIVPLMDVQRNFGLGNDRFFSRFGMIQSRLRRARLRAFMESMQIRPRRTGVQIRNLSGGNQQKVIIAPLDPVASEGLPVRRANPRHRRRRQGRDPRRSSEPCEGWRGAAPDIVRSR
jgi:ABC-type sugar transport system ATPase subunit